ncbi:hypothetical protein [Azospirillum cavernae]|uniref:hypothetical protein n=1 Tax=Azospirillum cavernae TaxID=2320860 RepID=UPI0011C3855D|nr:hypothetical protein [Azospirillum cavernae]
MKPPPTRFETKSSTPASPQSASPAAQAKLATTHLPPPTRFGPSVSPAPTGLGGAAPTLQAKRSTAPMPPPTRFGSPASLPSKAPGAAQAKFVAPPASVIQPCCDWISSLFSSRKSNVGEDAQRLVEPLQIQMTQNIMIKQTGGLSQDTYENKAWPVTAKGCFTFGVITCCTAIYVRGNEYCTVGHMFGTIYNTGIANGMAKVINDVGDEQITLAKVYFSALQDQIDGKKGKSMNALEEDQINLRDNLSRDLGDAIIECYLYNAREVNLCIFANGSVVVSPEKISSAN